MKAPTNETDAALAHILADCKSVENMKRHIATYAIIVQYLVGCMARDVHQTEGGIRALYSSWADMAVEQFDHPRELPNKKPH